MAQDHSVGLAAPLASINRVWDRHIPFAPIILVELIALRVKTLIILLLEILAGSAVAPPLSVPAEVRDRRR